MKTSKTLQQITKGFTLIELLVVIAVIGVLAGAIIVAINPTEQLQRGKDAGLKSSAQQLADAVNGYYAATGSLPASANWITSLTTSGDLKVLPTTPSGSGVNLCTTGGNVLAQNGYCYATIGSAPSQTNFLVFVRLNSIAEASKCSQNGAQAYYVYSSADAKAGTYCAASQPGAATSGLAASIF